MQLPDRKPEIGQATKPEKISGPYHYGIIVDVYDDGETTPMNEISRLLEVADKYQAACTGHGRARTSSLCFFSDKTLNTVREQLAQDLGPDIKIIRAIDMNALGENDCFDVSNEDGIIYPLPWESDADDKDAKN